MKLIIKTDVDEASSHDWEGVSLITSEIVKGLKKLIDEIHSGFATSEDYLECMFTITTKSQKLILLLGPCNTFFFFFFLFLFFFLSFFLFFYKKT